MKKIRRVVASVMVVGFMMFGLSVGSAAAGPHPGYWTPGVPDLCNVTSVEAWAEEKSGGMADNGFDRVGGPDFRGNQPGREPGINDCAD